MQNKILQNAEPATGGMTLYEQIVDALEILEPDGATTHELAEVLMIQIISISPCMRELERRGLVVDSGKKRRWEHGVKEQHRRESIVWRVACEANNTDEHEK